MSTRPVESIVEDDFPGQYPENEDLQRFVNRRKSVGRIWLTIFMLSTIVAIVALSALIYTIVRDSFGYVVVQNTVDPAQLVEDVEKERMLDASNTFSSEDDTELVAGIEDDPYAIGYFGYAYYINNEDKLRPVTVNGSEPNAETAESGAYPYARPLFIYTAKEVMTENPEVNGYVNFYLNTVNEVAAEVGYFPVSEAALAVDREFWLAANGMEGQPFPEIDPATVGDENGLSISGSSTVYPVSRALAIAFRRAGYAGSIDIQQTGTSAGFEAFCDKNGIDIADASRPIGRTEIEACEKANREPVEFKVGNDALAIAVSQKNDFLQDVSLEQLREIFTDYERWSELDPSFPDEPIRRYIPGTNSGTLDFFADVTFSRQLEDLTSEELIALMDFHLSAGRVRALDADKPLAERTHEELVEVVTAEIVKPRVVKSYNLVQSIFNPEEPQLHAETVPNSYVEFRNWLNLRFITTPQSSIPEYAGIRTAILGSLWVIFITIVVALPLGFGAAIYLEEYATMVPIPLSSG
jgi:ABC-type phosphate transport system substrate-binding protein